MHSRCHGRTICISPICSIGKMPSEDTPRRLHSYTDSSTWSTQPWYPLLLDLLIEQPLVLPRSQSLLKDPFNQVHPLLEKGQLELAAWKVSRNSTLREEFQRGLQISCWQDGAKAQTPHISQAGVNGVAGVLRGNLIPFQQMSNSFWTS